MLTIANLTAHYFFLHGTPDPAVLGRRLDRLLVQLPQAAAGRLHSASADENAVYRIRRLDVDLWLDNPATVEHELPARTAALTLAAVSYALVNGGPQDVMRYEDHAHFVAAFLVDLLAGQAWSRWMYEEFAQLRDLPVGQVAAQLLGARPGLLIPVARRLARAHQLPALILQLELGDIRLILRTRLGMSAPQALPLQEDTFALLHLLAGRLELERKPDSVTQARNTLRVYLAGALADPALAANDALIAAAYHLALLVSLWSARPAAASWRALAQQEVAGPAAIAQLLTGLGPDLEQATIWLRSVVHDTAGRRYVAELLALALPELLHRPAASPQNSGVKPARVTSAFAGLALLLPTLRDLRLHEHMGPGGLYQLLVATTGRAFAPLASGDEGIAWLAGLSAAEMAAAQAAPLDWPAMLRRLAEADPGPASALGGEEEPALAALAALVSRRFARGLRGFAASSPGFLARQFFNVSGVLTRTPAALEVYLQRAPLGVILQMAGRDGDQGALPWLEGRNLVIFLPPG